jgi:tRNA threonylcarbamoyladenosine biosynthesis protein TsaB
MFNHQSSIINNQLILAVETSSRVGSIALAVGQKLLADTTFAGPSRHSEDLFPSICSLLERFGKKPGCLEQVYISAGPGSFTGLRIAVTLAKMMHFAGGAKIVAVNSLDVTAANVLTPAQFSITTHESPTTGHEHRVSSIERIAAVLDAKRNQFFIAVYEHRVRQKDVSDFRCAPPLLSCDSKTRGEKIIPDSVMSAEEFTAGFASPDHPIWLLGDGLLYNKAKFNIPGIEFFDEKFWSPRASNVHLLGCQLALAGQFASPLTLTPNYLLRPDIKLKPR